MNGFKYCKHGKIGYCYNCSAEYSIRKYGGVSGYRDNDEKIRYFGSGGSRVGSKGKILINKTIRIAAAPIIPKKSLEYKLRARDLRETARYRLFVEQAKGPIICEKCSETDMTVLTAHHIHPISRGGDSDIGNLAILCQKCHKETHGLEKRRYNG